MKTTKLKEKIKKEKTLSQKLRKELIESCITLSDERKLVLGEDKFLELLDEENVYFEKENFFDSAETIKDTSSAFHITNVFKNGVKAIENFEGGTMFNWDDLDTHTIENLFEVLDDMQK
jgi:hypothetical protein